MFEEYPNMYKYYAYTTKEDKKRLEARLLGEIYFSLGKYQDCINAMTKCIELNSKAKNAYEFRGKAYLQLGKKKDGEKDLRISETLQ